MISETVRDIIVDADIVDDHVFPSFLPSGNKLPCIVYREITGIDQAYTHDSQGMLIKSRMQFDTWSDKHGGAEALALSLSSALRGSGLGIEIINSFDNSPAPEVESESKWRYTVEAYVWHEED